MKNRIIEICELGQPQSIIHRENEPITELIRTEVLIKELNKAINYTHSCTELKDKEVLTFEEYLISKGYKLSNTYVWQIDNRDLSNEDIIKQRKQYEYSL